MNGLGIDLIEIQRIEQSISDYGHQFIERIFTESEIKYCQSKAFPIPHFAARFAAKEAFSKAIGTGIGKQLGWHDITIKNEFSGRPIFEFSPSIAEQLLDHEILLSISHTHQFAVAVVRINKK